MDTWKRLRVRASHGRVMGTNRWTKMHQKGHHCETDQKVSNLSSVTNMVLPMRCNKTRNCYREGPNNTIHFQKRWCILVQLMHYPMTPPWFACSFTPPGVHLIQKWIILVTKDKIEIPCSVMPWCYFDTFSCILVHLMCDPVTPTWLALTPILFQVSSNLKMDQIGS